jgi:MurNAc alpha-1-phosphate uridylyltransferase
MVLAAGLGLRMRPLTLDRPKALVEVAGKALIDHVLDRLAAAGVERAVVNVHAFADQLEARLRARRDLEIAISDERDRLLETGGALKKARGLLGAEPIFVANIDSLWIEGERPALASLVEAWNPGAMDDLLLLVPTGRSQGFDAPGDFFRTEDGRLAHRGGAAAAPLAYMGVQILEPTMIDAWPDGAYPIFPHWMEMAAAGRLHGLVMDGRWMHVGDPAARAAAERALAEA